MDSHKSMCSVSLFNVNKKFEGEEHIKQEIIILDPFMILVEGQVHDKVVYISRNTLT